MESHVGVAEHEGTDAEPLGSRLLDPILDVVDVTGPLTGFVVCRLNISGLLSGLDFAAVPVSDIYLREIRQVF